jgi:hypothetical protein
VRSNESLGINLNIVFAAAIGHGDHDSNADQYRKSDQGPCGANAFQNTELPERGHEATDNDKKAQKIHASPFHDDLPIKKTEYERVVRFPLQSEYQRHICR